ncbi:hypothetical protein [Romboutsia timonensis]|uniref:hypothetical protein n=1 Tax=Romboutsia timonensis TaxID=1776391 RepID=UPI0023F6B1AA|nr:hypothetical protein [Romboutsia timonensis]
MMIDLNAIRKNMNIRDSKVINKMKQEGEMKMYSYLSGIDPDSSYTGDNVKSIMTLSGDIKWENIEDPSNALFNIGYSEQGNIIGILTNANALLQDMLLYCSLEDAKENLKEVLSIEVGSKSILGKRYAVDGKSPLTFALPVITAGGYKSYAVVIHNRHADEFIRIMESIDIDALTEEDMLLIAKDISFISRTQELAIDVAKDKTIQIVDTSQWLNMGIKSANYWLAQDKKIGDWNAKDNLYQIINAKKTGELMPEFAIEENIPEETKMKVKKEVVTSESISREVLRRAVEDYYNNHYKEMLLYSKETELNITCKAMAEQNKEFAQAIKQVLSAYRSYMIDNMPRNIEDEETAILLRKIYKEKTEAFASICRNTIYHLGLKAGYGFKDIAMIAYGTDLKEVSKDEGKFFRAVMPEEFKKLYANGKTATSREKLYFVDELVEDDILDGLTIKVDFTNGSAYDKDGVLIARASYKFNAKDCTLIFDDVSGHFYAEQELGIDLPEFGNEVLSRINLMADKEVLVNNTFKYLVKTANNSNIISMFDEETGQDITMASLGYYNNLTVIEQAMLLRSTKISTELKNKNFEGVKAVLSDYNRIKGIDLSVDINVKDIITVNKDSEYEANYVIITL